MTGIVVLLFRDLWHFGDAETLDGRFGLFGKRDWFYVGHCGDFGSRFGSAWGRIFVAYHWSPQGHLSLSVLIGDGFSIFLGKIS